MKHEYLTEIILSRNGSHEPIIVYRLKVDRYDCKPFRFECHRLIGFTDKQAVWNSSPNYYSLGIASKRMLSRAKRDRYEDNTLWITGMVYTETALIVSDLPDYYEVKPDGKVRMIR